jgi:acyl-CoA synthetase (AMP-forming)/AMP-acid ligase II
MVTVPKFKRIGDYVDYYAETAPDRNAAVLDGRAVSYSALKAAVDRCARALLANGVLRGDRIATLSPPTPDFLILFLAATSVGAIWTGLNPRYRLREIEHVIGDCRPRLLFARTAIGDRRYEEELVTMARHHEGLTPVLLDDSRAPSGWSYDSFLRTGDDVPQRDIEVRRASIMDLDPALIVYTSGTTGAPKGAMIPHRGLVTCALVQRDYLGVDPVRILNYLPINHIGCVGDISCYALVAGGTIIFMEQFDPARSMQLVQDERVTLWGGVPSALQMCVTLPAFSDYDLSALQLIAWGGAAAPIPLIERLREVCPRLACTYGLTESVGSVTFVTPCDDVDVLAHTVGRPVAEYELRIAAQSGETVMTGEVGELQVRGDFVMLGYWNRPEQTAEAIDDHGWLHTGDLACLRTDGNVQLVGRLKDMYKSGGYNVYPREIEEVLELHPGVAMAAVIGVPDALYQEVGKAYVLPRYGAEPTAAELEIHCRRHLANYKVPKGFVIKTDLPLLPIGKIDKQALRGLASGT